MNLGQVISKKLFVQTIQYKCLKQSQEIERNQRGLGNFDIYFCVLLTAIAEVLFVERRLGIIMSAAKFECLFQVS